MNSETEVENATEEAVERVGQGIRQVLLAKDAEILHLRSEVASLKATVANLKANAAAQSAAAAQSVIDAAAPSEPVIKRGPGRPRTRMVTDEPNVQLTTPGKFVTIMPTDNGNQPTNVGLQEAQQQLAASVLQNLKVAPGQTIGQLAKQLNLVPNQLTSLINALRKQGLVRISGQRRGTRYYIV